MPFQLFDPDAEVRITSGNLPHWFQPGATYFITFRTADSVPSALSARWHAERDAWLAAHGISASVSDVAAALSRLPPVSRLEYYSQFTERFESYLDMGAGECLLRQPAVADIVADALRFFDGVRYDLSDFVVMPNHVHVLAGFRPGVDVVSQCYSWKKFTAGKINKAIGRAGRFWQEESFDHLVRTPAHLAGFRDYVSKNPEKAHLGPGKYSLWQRHEERHTECAYYMEDGDRR